MRISPFSKPPRLQPDMDAGLERQRTIPALLATLLTLPAIAAAQDSDAGKVTTLPAVTVVADSPSPAGGERRAEGFSTRDNRLGVLGERPLLDTPFSVNVVTRELMDNMGVTDLKSLVRADPSLAPSFSGLGYYDAVSIRGLNLNNWTNYYKNGMLFANQAKTPFENIDRIEIHRGLTGFLQGFSTPGGSVNFVTERPTATLQRRVELYADQFGSFVPGVDIGGPLTADGRLGIRINAAGGKERYFVDEVETDRAFGSVALDWNPTSTVSIRIDAQTDRRDGTTQPLLLANSANQLPQGVDPKRYLGQPWQTYDTRTREFGVAADWKFSRNWTASARVNVTKLFRDDFSSSIDNIQPNGDFEVYEYKSPGEVRRSRNAEVALRGNLALGTMQHELALGVTTRRLIADFGDGVYELAGTSNLYRPVQIADPGSATPAVYNAFRNRDDGVFVSDFITFNPQWQALVGWRRAEVDFYSVFDTQTYTRTITTPTYAVIYKPLPNISLYGSYAEGLEQGESADSSAANANEQLRPKLAKQKEIGIKGELMEGRLAASAALFEVKVPLAYQDPTTDIFDYYGDRRHRGLELTASGGLWKGARLNAGAVLLDAKAQNTGDPDTEGKVPDNVAEKQLTLWLDQALPMPGLSAQFGARYTSRRSVDATTNLFAPSWTVFDAGLRYLTKLSGHNLQLGLNVVNLTNKTYFAESTGGQLNFGSPRAVSMNAMLEF